MSIALSDIIDIPNPEEYKIHLATWNGKRQPLDVFVTDKERWKDWNSYKGVKDDFNRKYIFSLIDFYHEPNIWLFGGVFEVLSRSPKQHAHSYKVELTDRFHSFNGRLKVKWTRHGRAKSRVMEKIFDQLDVSEILQEEYTGEVFCGYENINHDFHVLENIFLKSKQDWKAALENVKGVYLITDKENGKRYVGAAYGDSGIWSRWSCCMGTGHGYNDELTHIIRENSKDYARNNFIFTLLEYRSMKTDDSKIITREKYWKEVLLTRGEFGYNKN